MANVAIYAFCLTYAVVCLFVFVLGIIEIDYSFQFNNQDNDCHNDKLIRPVTWLFIDGISLIIKALSTASLFIAPLYNPIMIISTFAIVHVMTSAFSFIWLVIGLIMLIRDNWNCEPASLSNLLWIIMIARFIFSIPSITSCFFPTKKSTPARTPSQHPLDYHYSRVSIQDNNNDFVSTE